MRHFIFYFPKNRRGHFFFILSKPNEASFFVHFKHKMLIFWFWHLNKKNEATFLFKSEKKIWNRAWETNNFLGASDEHFI